MYYKKTVGLKNVGKKQGLQWREVFGRDCQGLQICVKSFIFWMTMCTAQNILEMEIGV